jgi:alkanesulfonate monooxygenase SsuD/methylene tetrahydromethanopterin reductase-like flavin-dependent oxidoreductase (luciferase family)
MTTTAVVAATREEAAALMLPHLHMMAQLAAAQEPGRISLVEDAQATTIDRHVKRVVEAGLARAVVGTPTEGAGQIRDTARQFGVNEVMVNPVASAFRGTSAARAPAREETLEYLAEVLL